MITEASKEIWYLSKEAVQQLENKESQVRNLQLQIKPHFLYNTLDTISSIAAVNGAFLICDLCEKLGENFRYSLGTNYGEFLTVEQELSHTQNYIYIQKTRFGNKFEAYYNVEPGLKKNLILGFILQPIVENAIIHGLSVMPQAGTLEILIYQEDDFLILKITDDGLDLKPEVLYEVENDLSAIEILKSHPVDIVITDIRMADMDGLTALIHVRSFWKLI